jgi:release factor glutamine methyltransferase
MTFLQIRQQSSLPPKEVEILLTFLLKKSREYLLTHPETKISAATHREFKKLEKKRLTNWSIAVLIGQKEFYGLSFKVDKNVLVPRPETEMIIDEIKELKTNKPLIIDLGTGSGAIIVSLAKNLSPNSAKFMAVDISTSALKIAKENAKLNGVNRIIKFYHGNLLLPILKSLPSQNLVIAANLPYLTKEQIANSPSIKREPKLALDGGLDGLKYYLRLFKQLERIKYKSLSLFLEIDPSQTVKIKRITKHYFPGSSLEIKKDLAGLNRFVIIKKTA